MTTGLDPQARRDTWGLVEEVRRRGVTVVLVTHYMDEALAARGVTAHDVRMATPSLEDAFVRLTSP